MHLYSCTQDKLLCHTWMMYQSVQLKHRVVDIKLCPTRVNYCSRLVSSGTVYIIMLKKKMYDFTKKSKQEFEK